MVRVYSTTVTSKVNDLRNSLQQKLRSAYIKAIKDGEEVPTANQLLKVVARPDLLKKEAEYDSKNRPISKNQEHNKKNEKYVNRFLFLC